MPPDAPGSISGTLFDQAPDGILLVSPDDHTILDVNRTICEISGWTRDELVGRPAVELLHPDDVAASPLQPERAAGRNTVINERRQVRKDGGVIWCQSSARLTDQGFLVFVRDITRVIQDRERLDRLTRIAALRTDLTAALLQRDATLPAVLDRAAAGLADAIGDVCVIALVDSYRGLLVPTAFHHRDPLGEKVLRSALTLRPLQLGRGLAGTVAVDGVPVRVTGIPVDEVASTVPPEYRSYLDRFPVTSMVIAPLQGQEGIIGTLGVARGPEYSEDDEETVLDLAHLVAAAIEDSRHEAQLRRANFLLQTVTNTLPAMISYWDADLCNRFANEAYGRWAGMEPDDIEGRHVRDVLGDELYERDLARLHGALAGEPQEFDRPIIDPSGNERHVQVSYVPDRRPDGHVAGFVALITDVTQWSNAAAEFEYQATHDALTGLANRRALRDRLAAALVELRGDARVLALFLIDLDDFKQINDSRGHQIGDAVLIATADRIRSLIRPEDTAARLGGDEFVVVCEVANRQEADEICERLAAALDGPIPIAGGQSLVTSASVGVAVVADGDETSAEEVLARADRAMFSKKRRPSSD